MEIKRFVYPCTMVKDFNKGLEETIQSVTEQEELWLKICSGNKDAKEASAHYEIAHVQEGGCWYDFLITKGYPKKVIGVFVISFTDNISTQAHFNLPPQYQHLIEGYIKEENS